MSVERKRLPRLEDVPGLDDIERIHSVIGGYVRQTPILHSSSINEMLGAELYFKCENLQRGGSFKIRGALSAALALSDEELANGLACHSSGNHAQGVALAARLLGVPAYVVMPKDASKIKVEACKAYGATIFHSEPGILARQKLAEKVAAKKGACLIHPYNDYHILAGQGTAALEFFQEQGDLHHLLVPVSGGGLLAGSGIVASSISPRTKVLGTEPNMADDAYRSFHSGKIKHNKSTDTICDALKGELGEKTFPIIQEHVHDFITVREKSIIKAMKLIWQRLKIVVEPSCAVPLAAVMDHKKMFQGSRVGIIITGGNVDLDHLPF